MAWRHLDHMAKVLADEEQFYQDYDLDVSEDGSWAQVTQLGGILKVLQERSGQDVEVFADWLTSAAWFDVVLVDAVLDHHDTYVPSHAPHQACGNTL